MLEEFKVDNFLSWLNLSFQPKDMNLLVGLNNTGKTNLCKALQFLSCTVTYPLDECAGIVNVIRQQMTNFSYNKPTVDFLVRASVPFEDSDARYEYSLTLRAPSSISPDATIEVEAEKLTVSAKGFQDTMLLDNERGAVKLLHEKDHLKGETNNYVQTYAPLETTMLHRLYDLETNDMSNRFKKYLSSWQYYALSQLKLREPNYKPNDFWLIPDGRNLASVIHRLKKTDEKSYRNLLSHIQKLDPNIDFINFGGGDTEPSVFMYFVDKSGVSVPAWTASSGTLRFLALSYIMLSQPESLPHPLVVIEEPENGLYVGYLREILEMATDSACTAQLLFTSHSPYFIDLFDTRLDSVFVTSRDKYRSDVSRIDQEKAKRRLAEYALGEQHYRELFT